MLIITIFLSRSYILLTKMVFSSCLWTSDYRNHWIYLDIWATDSSVSSACMLLCTARVRAWQNPLPQTLHLNGFSFRWMYLQWYIDHYYLQNDGYNTYSSTPGQSQTKIIPRTLCEHTKRLVGLGYTMRNGQKLGTNKHKDK